LGALVDAGAFVAAGLAGALGAAGLAGAFVTAGAKGVSSLGPQPVNESRLTDTNANSMNLSFMWGHITSKARKNASRYLH
jgi:hypothetical protein